MRCRCQPHSSLSRHSQTTRLLVAGEYRRVCYTRHAAELSLVLATLSALASTTLRSTSILIAPPMPSEVQRANSRLGMRLFAVYLTLYLGFVLISAFAASTMETPVFAGLNLAVIYGFALIIGALVLALVYGAMCKSEPEAEQPASEAGDDEA